MRAKPSSSNEILLGSGEKDTSIPFFCPRPIPGTTRVSIDSGGSDKNITPN